MEKRRQYISEWMNLSFVNWKCFNGWGVVLFCVQDVLLYTIASRHTNHPEAVELQALLQVVVLGQPKEGEIKLTHPSDYY